MAVAQCYYKVIMSLTFFILLQVVVFACIILLSVAYRTKKSKVTELCEHLQAIGINASVMEETKWWWGGIKGQPQSWVDNVMGVIQLKGRDIDAIDVINTSGQSMGYLDSIVRTSSPDGSMRKDYAKLIMKRSFMGNLLAFFFIYSAKIVDIEWAGDTDLARELNFDNPLKNMLLNMDPRSLRGLLEIVPEPKYGCTRIRTDYLLPSLELFDILETIARHIKSKNLSDNENKLKSEQMKKTWKPVAAGVMVIAFCLFVGFALMALMGLQTIGEGWAGHPEAILYLVTPFPMVVLALVGGIYAVKRSKWKLALGSISAFFLVVPSFLFIAWVNSNSGYPPPLIVFGIVLFLIGIASVVLIALSKNEFK
jgi:hypothetical protein